MRNYLSFGGGVNSVALYLLLQEQGVEFEAVYVWMPDHPKTHEYLLMMESKGYPITVIFPDVPRKKGGPKYWNLYQMLWEHRLFPVVFGSRICSRDFKVYTLQKYFKTPCFSNIGIDFSEAHRAKLYTNKGIENRFPLIEHELTRQDCIKMIKRHGLPVPIKSGCFFCPFQGNKGIIALRKYDPDLYCLTDKLEKRVREVRSLTLLFNGLTVEQITNESNRFLFDDMAYPPCECGL